MTDGLFPEPERVAGPLDPLAGLTPGQRLRARQRRVLEQGWHPISKQPLAPEKGTCGDCIHRVLQHHGNRSWPKCERSLITSGQATDCLASFVACRWAVPRWEADPSVPLEPS